MSVSPLPQSPTGESTFALAAHCTALESVVDMQKERTNSMIWILFALGAALAWGLYGPVLHRGQTDLGSPMRALLCVGVAYFLIGVLVPLDTLSYRGDLHGFTMKGSLAATIGGALGAFGAICIIFAF